MTGIYKIENLINHKVYIGQSINISQRWRSHRSHYQTENGYLYRAMRKYGIENFSFEIIEECQPEELNDKEIKWIAYYKSNDNEYGYNLTAGGGNVSERCCKLTQSQIFEIYDLLRQGKVQQEIADKYGVTQQIISLINLGELWIQSNVLYPIKENHKELFCLDCGIKISRGSCRCKNCAVKAKAIQYYASKNYPKREELKDLIRNKPFTEIGKMFGVTDNSVKKWCVHYNLPSKKKDIKQISDIDWQDI